MLTSWPQDSCRRRSAAVIGILGVLWLQLDEGVVFHDSTLTSVTSSMQRSSVASGYPRLLSPFDPISWLCGTRPDAWAQDCAGLSKHASLSRLSASTMQMFVFAGASTSQRFASWAGPSSPALMLQATRSNPCKAHRKNTHTHTLAGIPGGM